MSTWKFAILFISDSETNGFFQLVEKSQLDAPFIELIERNEPLTDDDSQRFLVQVGEASTGEVEKHAMFARLGNSYTVRAAEDYELLLNNRFTHEAAWNRDVGRLNPFVDAYITLIQEEGGDKP